MHLSPPLHLACEWNISVYCIVGKFRWYIVFYSFEFSIRIKFLSSDSRIFQVLQATLSGTHVGLIRTFRLMVHASFTIKAMIHGYHIYRDLWSTIIDDKLLCEKESGNLGPKFSSALISHILYVFEIRKNLHHSKIPH